ncbi:MAG: TIGR03084 family metal-binding protein [Myxococcota bacterium]
MSEGSTVLQESRDLLDEADALHAFLTTLGDADWGRPTAFMGWTPWDVVAHLHFYDRLSILALEGEEAFVPKRDELIVDIQKGMTNAELARREYAGWNAAQLLERWITTCRDMAKQLGESEPKRRLPWFGPSMGVRMFTTARLMENWAHGQEIYDLTGVHREPTDRLKHIATLGVKTFGWTFSNRGLEKPGPPPYVRLTAPSGAVWEWNEPNESACIRGDAIDFCHVVTQVRNVEDTRLEVVGAVADRWMSIAQCFAGVPVDPPKPGERKGA